MFYYHNPTTDQYAELLHLDDHDIAWLLIDGKTEQMPWQKFITSFIHLCLKKG